MSDQKIKDDVVRHYDERVAACSEDQLALKEQRMLPLYEAMKEAADICGETTVGIIGSSTGSLPLFVAKHAKAVVGVDLSKESLRFAEKRARDLGVDNVEFLWGDAEALPIEDDSMDVVLSDCVINLVPDKLRAFGEIRRVLKRGRRLVIADPVRTSASEQVPSELWAGCIAGTIDRKQYNEMLREAGFKKIEIEDITDLARQVFAEHQDRLDSYGLEYVMITAV